MLLTPVFDLLSLLVVGFLVLGVMTGIVGARGSEAGPPAQALAAAVEAQRHAAAAAETQQADVARLRATVAQGEESGRELEDAEKALENGRAELAALAKEVEAERARLIELQAALAAAREPRFGFTSGAPLVRANRRAEQHYGIMISEGRLIPVRNPYFEGSRHADGTETIWPVQRGLTIGEALARGSVIMQAIRGREFRRSGRVLMVVLPDSFATFRAFRDALVREGIDFGWEPMTSTTIGIGGASARSIESQAPGR
jgi:hypothetical protein